LYVEPEPAGRVECWRWHTPPAPRGYRLSRPLVIVADDYGIGPDTSRGILELALAGRLTATVLMVNCPDAERAVGDWLRADPPADLGWHPNLTLDRPILPPAEVPSLVRADGTFHALGGFLRRVAVGRIRANEVRAECRAQYRRFVELVGRPPAVVNSHQHASLFPPCDRALLDVLAEADIKPFVRRVVEPVRALFRVPGARVKRATLTVLGRRASRRATAAGFPSCDWLAGVTDPAYVADPRFWERWLAALPASGSVEIGCHPGHRDPTLVGRDCDGDAGLARRTHEMELLRSAAFRTACERVGLVPIRPSQLPTVAG
jgi:predicted glycoside hydrolase/deacetylase ChbG (UPF0249 family)